MNRRYVLPKPPARKTEPDEMDEKVKDLFRHVMKHGMEFRPWLVALDGEVVGQVPDSLDRCLMQAHRYYKDNQDASEVCAPETSPAA